MAVGLTTALIGSAVLGAGASALGASKNSKAIKKSTAAQTASNNASIALQRETYAQNQTNLNPFLQRGNAAGNAYNALLGIGGTSPATPQPNAFGQTGGYQPPQTFGQGYDPRTGAMSLSGGDYSMLGGDQIYGQNAFSNIGQQQYGQPQAVPEQPNALDQQRSAFDQFRNSTGYAFRLGEGNDSINSAYAAKGTLRSGAAMKALARYNQDYASNEFGNYMGMLGNQQGIGLQAGSALAGVGQNFANNVTALNGQQANALSNAAVARANNTNALISGVGSSFGNALGMYGQSQGWFGK